MFRASSKIINRNIVWYCGDSWEAWGPNSLKKGIPGSQQAVIHLSTQFAKLGHSVTVYNRCDAHVGMYEGVEYVPFQKFVKDREYDILIVWREAGLDILDFRIKARKLFLELQDIPMRESKFQEPRLKQVDKIFVKSKFHRESIAKNPRFKFIPKNKFITISNGINIDNSATIHEKDHNSLIYASNYSRGLEYMLKYGWPIIKQTIPEAHLDIYYGWEQYDSYKADSKSQDWKAMMIELMKSSGVIDHGRVGCEELLFAKSKASIHYYGCSWPETDCISIRESAAVGCVPFTTDFGPLGEKKYCLKVKGAPESRKTQETLAWQIIEYLKHPNKLERFRWGFKRAALRDSWENIACQWIKYF